MVSKFLFFSKRPFKLDFLHALKQQGPKGLQNVIKPTSHWISPSIHTAVLFLWPVGKFNTVSLLWSILIYSLKCITLELVLLVDMSMWHGNEPRPQLRQGDRTRQETAHISPCKWCFHATFIWIQALSHKITPCLLFGWAGTNLLCLHSILLLNSCTARAGPAGSNTPHLRAHGCEWWEREYSKSLSSQNSLHEWCCDDEAHEKRHMSFASVCFDSHPLSFQRLPLPLLTCTVPIKSLETPRLTRHLFIQNLYTVSHFGSNYIQREFYKTVNSLNICQLKPYSATSH